MTLLFLPPYSSNLNFIERLWKFVKAECLHSHYYKKFPEFGNAISTWLSNTSTEHQSRLDTLLTRKFNGLSPPPKTLNLIRAQIHKTTFSPHAFTICASVDRTASRQYPACATCRPGYRVRTLQSCAHCPYGERSPRTKIGSPTTSATSPSPHTS